MTLLGAMQTFYFKSLEGKIMKKAAILSTVAALLVTGCSTSSTLDYATPANNEVKNKRIVNQDFEQTWDRLVRELSADFFVINNIEKASRIINVSFSVNRPDEYVDCGISNRSFTNPQGKTEHYKYSAASAASYWVGADQPPHFPIAITRSTDLEGRVNIYVAPTQGTRQTEIVVNSKYSLGIKQEGVLHNMYMVPVSQISPGSVKINFETLKPSIPDIGAAHP
jgi:hypothetical protein